ncbi:g9566 [Coccomyxa viridis]|uniref:histidine kinase n=1 Tax=Coccomyxa viridis TaxID=1274662 RepID=A0ABP1G3M5_9CHLO
MCAAIGAPDRPQALVVDDSQVDRFVLKRLLEHQGFLVVVAGDGQKAVKYYMEHADSITCIWMDINMPIQDGLQATLQIRRIERGRLRRQASRASFVKDLVLVGEGRQVSLSQRHCTCPSQMPVPIVGVSACGKSEQLGNAFSSGLLHDITDRPWKNFGMDLLVEKPMTASKLKGILEQLDGRTPSIASASWYP